MTRFFLFIIIILLNFSLYNYLFSFLYLIKIVITILIKYTFFSLYFSFITTIFSLNFIFLTFFNITLLNFILGLILLKSINLIMGNKLNNITSNIVILFKNMEYIIFYLNNVVYPLKPYYIINYSDDFLLLFIFYFISSIVIFFKIFGFLLNVSFAYLYANFAFMQILSFAWMGLVSILNSQQIVEVSYVLLEHSSFNDPCCEYMEELIFFYDKVMVYLLYTFIVICVSLSFLFLPFIQHMVQNVQWH